MDYILFWGENLCYSQRVVKLSSLNNMGVWVIATVILGCSLLSSILTHPLTIRVNPSTRALTKHLEPTKGLLVHPLLLSNPQKPMESTIKAASTNYQPYSVIPFSQEDAVDVPYTKTLGYNNHPNDVHLSQSKDYINPAYEFNSVEPEENSYRDGELQNKGLFLDTSGYKQYEDHSSFNLVGPKQVEIIDSKSYHKEVEPYHTEDFNKHHHKEQEDHAEVHYHQHKHLHKHQHKQDHMHKHKEEHKHEHEHQHHSNEHHEHKHDQHHKHHHHSEHKHDHHNKHWHNHKQEHKHDHHHGHHHEHKEKEEHKHEEEHKHKHDKWSEHKHKHWNDHKHHHHHGHKHWSDHKHEHKQHHSHKHGHKHHYKHR